MPKRRAGKPKRSAIPLGRAMIKDKNRQKRGINAAPQSGLHVMDADSEDKHVIRAKLLTSATEMNSLNDFLATAELADEDFTATRGNVKIVMDGVATDIDSMNGGMRASSRSTHTMSTIQDGLQVPRRPPWNNKMSAEELDQMEREYFLDWRRSLAEIEKIDNITITPFEKNLEVWRQLWRVVERSDVLVQIVDARNPLMFRCPDLEKYVDEHLPVEECAPKKKNLLLVNKADLLTESQRLVWSNYFKANGLECIFFSAAEEALKAEKEENSESDSQSEESGEQRENGEEEEVEEKHTPQFDKEEEPAVLNATEIRSILANLCTDAVVYRRSKNTVQDTEDSHNQPEGTTHTGKIDKAYAGYVGMVGYPNVGKSSCINVITGEKKVSAGATPGKTKHLQTIFVNNELCLVDCPGLVFPHMATTKEDLVCNGVLPVDHLRDPYGPVSLVTKRIDKSVFESLYGFMPPVSEGHTIPSAMDLLGAFATSKGMMSAKGVPNYALAARHVLKDYVNGKLLYCHPPPGLSFNQDIENINEVTANTDSKHSQTSAVTVTATLPSAQQHVMAHTTGRRGQRDFHRISRPFDHQ